ncbi:type-F conjugative transfer system secretin TraK [Cereibacter sp. SYSU M97828]|nr:type-F conjugative transfer system secretin TraK [Cereibacter flavus]
MIKHVLSAAVLALTFAVPAFAQQNLTTRPNGTVKISASPTDVTRISIAGDRIRRIIKDQSQFQEMNDESTGDVFLRYGGQQDKLVPETGYIITERGITIGYELTPRVNLGAETVVIRVNGVPDSPAATPSGNAGRSAQRSEPAFELAVGEGGGGGYSSGLVALTRSVINKHIGGKAPPSRSHGSVVATENGSGLRARVMVASGGNSGRYVRPQDFYNNRVVAVWVQQSNLSRNDRAWVVVVEKR